MGVPNKYGKREGDRKQIENLKIISRLNSYLFSWYLSFLDFTTTTESEDV